MEAKVIGVYEEPTADECHLVEVEIREAGGPLDIAAFTQEDPDQPRDDWQVPWDETYLDAAGETVVGDSFNPPEATYWDGSPRIAFFMHYLDLSRPLVTPAGDIQLPPLSTKPERLAVISYEAL